MSCDVEALPWCSKAKKKSLFPRHPFQNSIEPTPCVVCCKPREPKETQQRSIIGDNSPSSHARPKVFRWKKTKVCSHPLLRSHASKGCHCCLQPASCVSECRPTTEITRHLPAPGEPPECHHQPSRAVENNISTCIDSCDLGFEMKAKANDEDMRLGKGRGGGATRKFIRDKQAVNVTRASGPIQARKEEKKGRGEKKHTVSGVSVAWTRWPSNRKRTD